ncbi:MULTISPECIES: eCIS core domain-containing protein [Saccharothrix]|uniref:eCIS core domain-containing protein n=1 Tax=Saccharothrix TaxID=2071 RepID=UPI00093EE922|nr:DUF4157 domain-containing protein [Saccharothrix sp. CB00851]OKI20307.1 hypothetical protein A6A25_38240 [Saccharothrix sp. CB00851]
MSHTAHQREPDRRDAHDPARAPKQHTAPATGRGPLSVDRILAMQRAVGNAAVARMLSENGADVQRSAVHEVLRTPGKPLDAPVREDMESRMGADFSDVRVHTDGAAAQAAESVRAEAFTTGSHLVFGQGQYDPSSSTGRHRLAHELTHVLQQRSGPVAGTDTGAGVRVSDPSDRFERAAEDNARRTMAAQRTPDAGAHPTTEHGAVQRYADHAPARDDVPHVQRVLDYSAVQHHGNTEAADAETRGRWLRKLVYAELAETLKMPKWTGEHWKNWKKTNVGVADRVDPLVRSIEPSVTAMELDNEVTRAQIGELNDILHQIETVVDERRAAPSAIAGTLIGNEFTFVDDALRTAAGKAAKNKNSDIYKLMKDPYNQAAQRWADAMAHLGGPTPERGVDRNKMTMLTYRFTSADYGVDWRYQVTADQACVEVITDKAAASDVYAGAVGDLMDQYVFNVAKAVGLETDITIGGGHINIDETTSVGHHGNPRAARVLAEFIDEVYKDEKYWQARDPDEVNAPFLSELNDAKKKQVDYDAVIKKFNAENWTIPVLVRHLLTDVFNTGNTDQANPEKYHALNFSAMREGTPEEQRRLEFRRVPAQPDRQVLLEELTRLAGLLKTAREKA